MTVLWSWSSLTVISAAGRKATDEDVTLMECTHTWLFTHWKSSKQAIQVSGVVTLLHVSYAQAKESQTTLRNEECNTLIYSSTVSFSHQIKSDNDFKN